MMKTMLKTLSRRSLMATTRPAALRAVVVRCDFSTTTLMMDDKEARQQQRGLHEAMSMQIYDNLKEKSLAYERPSQSAVIMEAVVEATESPTTKAASPEEVYIKAHAEEAAKAVHEGLSPSQRMSAILEGMSMQIYDHLREKCTPFAQTTSKTEAETKK